MNIAKVHLGEIVVVLNFESSGVRVSSDIENVILINQDINTVLNLVTANFEFVYSHYKSTAAEKSDLKDINNVSISIVKLPQPTLPEPPTAKPSGGAGAGTATKVLGTIGLLLSPISTGDGLDNAMYSSEIIKKFSYEGHGNKLYNWNTHIVDVFFFKPSDNRTPVIKYGISDETRYSLERPERQKPYYKSRFGATADYRILTRTLTRAGALAIERNLVELHLKIWGTVHRDQLRPTIN